LHSAQGVEGLRGDGGVALHGQHLEQRDGLVAAIKADPSNARFHNSRGVCLEKTGDPAGALKCFQRALELQPRSVKFLVNAAKALKAQNRFQEALTHMLQVAEIEPKVRPWAVGASDRLPPAEQRGPRHLHAALLDLLQSGAQRRAA
jgi:tetratricopeptide (TPR) repeat protein